MLETLRAIMNTTLSSGHLTERSVELPLRNLKTWSENSSFRIDALGLVTLLGADEVNLAIGSLQHRQFTRALPLLATFVVAGDRFTTEQPGFVLYNFSAGITSTELKGWFTRWLMSQKVRNATTVFQWKTNTEVPSSWKSFIAPSISFLLVAPLLALTVLMGDWYGVGNTLAIVFTVVTRLHIVAQQRKARDDLAKDTSENYDSNSKLKLKTLCVVRSDGKMVTIKAPQSVLMTFVKGKSVEHPKYYKGARRIAWLALGIHMLILGMCTLVAQIYTVVLLVFSTWALSSDLDAKFEIGSPEIRGFEHKMFTEETVTLPFSRDWVVTKTDYPHESAISGSANDEKSKDVNPPLVFEDKRQVAWARILLNEEQEQMMKYWNLFPHGNSGWKEGYGKFKAKFETWARTSEDQQSTSTSTSPASPARPSAQTTPSAQHLLPQSSPSGTSGSSIGGTPTSGASRSPSPAITTDTGVTPAKPTSSI